MAGTSKKKEPKEELVTASEDLEVTETPVTEIPVAEESVQEPVGTPDEAALEQPADAQETAESAEAVESAEKKPNVFVRFGNAVAKKCKGAVNGVGAWVINSRVHRLEKIPKKKDVTLAHKNDKAAKRLAWKLGRELRPLYEKAQDVAEVAERIYDEQLKKFDLKQHWGYRLVNHAYAKSLFADKESEARKKLESGLARLSEKRCAKIEALEAAKQKYIAEHGIPDSEREAARAEYEQKIAERQGQVDEFYAQAEKGREETVAALREKCKAKIEELNKSKFVAMDDRALPDDVVLRVEHLCMYFGGLHAVEDLSFDVKKGEIFGLIGPNGAGKTTVFNCITQFYKCTSGELTFRNNEGAIIDLKRKVVHDVLLEGIARTFQNVEVIKEISVLENLLVAATRSYGSNLAEQALNLPILGIEEEALKTKALKILADLDLLAYKDWLAWGLPYGILKKVEIARALMADPKLLILDEPAAGLNNTETAQLAKLIVGIRDRYGCSILLVEHDMSLVMSICERICAISFGKMLAIGTAKEIQANKQVQEAYLGTEDA